jgi:23S rRNA pseudouridine1911/1915/1917 synthase
MKEDTLYEHHRFTVDPKQEPIRIDKFLIDRIEKVSRNRIQQGIKKGYVLVNEEEVKANYKVSPGDIIIVSYPKKPKLGDKIQGEDIDLNIVYEDPYLMVVDKPYGQVVHPGIGNMEGTLVHAIVHYLSKTELPIMPGNLADRPGLVHRIDKDTSGLLVIAKTEQVMSELAKQFKAHSVQRTYRAIVWGQPEPESGTIDSYIGRHPRNRLIYQSFSDEDQGKHAITHYKVLEGLYYVSLVECRLETGRTHQIRVHMKSIGHTIFSDHRYGGDKILKGTVFSKYKQFVDNCFEILPRQALHAATLGFTHPISKESLFFESPLPEDMLQALNKWRHYVSHKKNLISDD